MTSGRTALDVGKIERETAHLALRPDIKYIPTVDSTNRYARDLSTRDWRTGTTIMTDFQEAGRGRTGRDWVAPPGTCLLLSLMIALPMASAPAEGIMMMTLAVAEAIENVTTLRPTLKWPNDVLLQDSKLSGILAEYTTDRGRRRLILGAGINVNFDAQLAGLEHATSVSAQAGVEVSREALAIALFRRLDVWYRALTENADLLFASWAGRIDTIGSDVLVTAADSTWEGIAVGVLRNGGLQVQESGGEIRTVYAADVSVRKR